MSTILVSDAHLQGPRDPTQQQFVTFVRTARYDELVIVGDLFDLWLVPPGVVPTPAVPVIAALHDAVCAGRTVTWLGGNHDPSPDLSQLGIQGGRDWRTTVGGQAVLAVHGDEGADPSLSHRAVQRVLRSRTAGHGARVVGVDRLWTLGRVISGAMRDRHDAAGLQQVLLRQNALADRLLATADVVVVGHSHAPGILPRSAGTLINLGDWFEHRTFARIEHGRIELMRWTGTEEVALEAGPPHRRTMHLRGRRTPH